MQVAVAWDTGILSLWRDIQGTIVTGTAVLAIDTRGSFPTSNADTASLTHVVAIKTELKIGHCLVVHTGISLSMTIAFFTHSTRPPGLLIEERTASLTSVAAGVVLTIADRSWHTVDNLTSTGVGMAVADAFSANFDVSNRIIIPVVYRWIKLISKGHPIT